MIPCVILIRINIGVNVYGFYLPLGLIELRTLSLTLNKCTLQLCVVSCKEITLTIFYLIVTKL